MRSKSALYSKSFQELLGFAAEKSDINEKYGYPTAMYMRMLTEKFYGLGICPGNLGTSAGKEPDEQRRQRLAVKLESKARKLFMNWTRADKSWFDDIGGSAAWTDLWNNIQLP